VLGVYRPSPRGAWPYFCSQKKIKPGGHGELVPVGCLPLFGSGVPSRNSPEHGGERFLQSHYFYKAGKTASSLPGDVSGVRELAGDLKECCFIFGNICRAKNKKSGNVPAAAGKKLLRHFPAHPDIVDHDKAVIDHRFDFGEHGIDLFRRIDHIDDDREV